MKTIDLTSPEAALAYLESISADKTISLPGSNEANTNEGDAVSVITGESANDWANSKGEWEWTADSLVEAMRSEMGLPARYSAEFRKNVAILDCSNEEA